jgi:hypothetical protein
MKPISDMQPTRETIKPTDISWLSDNSGVVFQVMSGQNSTTRIGSLIEVRGNDGDILRQRSRTSGNIDGNFPSIEDIRSFPRNPGEFRFNPTNKMLWSKRTFLVSWHISVETFELYFSAHSGKRYTLRYTVSPKPSNVPFGA